MIFFRGVVSWRSTYYVAWVGFHVHCILTILMIITFCLSRPFRALGRQHRNDAKQTACFLLLSPHILSCSLGFDGFGSICGHQRLLKEYMSMGMLATALQSGWMLGEYCCIIHNL
ncbi:hypothetical protein BDV25DRAFT_109105 [Aspergillus avenaceus]|uniref:Uncharacterized protein n=1 Tax=Aspergillus avenaceus TaxID=36643 RepID=A0A5N6U8G4_ASPAV|nr:hypothetical protein BDV25DRAFT_109105 [Aspergillus avenaceus]